jgi:hypothetical protein
MNGSFSSQLRNIRRCFAATAALGLLLVGFGLVIVPLLPVSRLDVVLTPDQLRDEVVREETLEMLEKAGGNEWLVWTVSGAAVSAISVVGLRLSREERAK